MTMAMMIAEFKQAGERVNVHVQLGVGIKPHIVAINAQQRLRLILGQGLPQIEQRLPEIAARILLGLIGPQQPR
jgi:hypothetical protein